MEFNQTNFDVQFKKSFLTITVSSKLIAKQISEFSTQFLLIVLNPK